MAMNAVVLTMIAPATHEFFCQLGFPLYQIKISSSYIVTLPLSYSPLFIIRLAYPYVMSIGLRRIHLATVL